MPISAGNHRFSPSSSQALTEFSRDGFVCCVVSSDGRNSAESSEMRGMSICAETASHQYVLLLDFMSPSDLRSEPDSVSDYGRQSDCYASMPTAVRVDCP